MARRFYVCILRGTCDPTASEMQEFDTSEQVQAYLLEHGEEVDGNRESVWVIFGERFGFDFDRKPTACRLRGPE